MIRVAIITEEQAESLRGVQWGDDSYCNPVQDGMGRWVISLEEMTALGLECELVEWVEPEQDELTTNND
jgi:hypothetical protein